MTKAEYEAYHKEVTDKYGTPIKVRDTVVISDGYARDVHIGVVLKFCYKSIKIGFRYIGWTRMHIAYRRSNTIIKICNGNTIFNENEING